MERYLVAKPLRIVQIKEKSYVISEPSKNSKVNLNEYVIGFLKLIGDKDILRVSEVEEYLGDKSQDYKVGSYIVFRDFIRKEILIPYD